MRIVLQMGNRKKISVIMGIRNCANVLSEAIDSIINQSYTDWELIMCDDASTDGTYEKALSYVDKYPDKMILLRNDENKYLAYSLNRCLGKATGYYIARMDGDDLSDPKRFEKQVAFLQEHPGISLVGCSMQRFSDEGGLADIDSKPGRPTKFDLRYGPTFNHATIMTYKSVYDSLDGYVVSERTIRGQDYDLWFRFYAKGYVGANMQEPLYLVREDMSAIKRRTSRVRWNGFRTAQMGYKLLGFPKSWIVARFFQTVGKSLVPSRAMMKYRELQAKSK